MASLTLSHSVASSFSGHFHILPSPSPVRSPYRNPRTGNGSVVSVRATADIVLVEKSEIEKPYRLKTAYTEKIIPQLKEEFKYTNVHQVPKIEKIVVNCGMGDAASNAKGLEAALNDLAQITGQRPVKTRARASIATFKIREGQALGLAVTLRGNIMWSFLDRFINLALPRTRDFQGVTPSSFDGNGNFNVGIRDQGVFPEIKFDLAGKTRGMDVCITTTANTDQEGQKLLALMGMPFTEGAAGSSQPVVAKKKLMRHHFDKKNIKGGKPAKGGKKRK